jgi:hypothetical protein
MPGDLDWRDTVNSKVPSRGIRESLCPISRWNSHREKRL